MNTCEKCGCEIDDASSFCTGCLSEGHKSSKTEVVLAEAYVRMRDEIVRVRELCQIIEPFASNHAREQKGYKPYAARVHDACRELRSYIY